MSRADELKRARERRRIRLRHAEQLSPGVRQLTFEQLGGSRIEYAPGQYINLFFPGEDPRLQRSYSLTRSDGELEIAVTRVADGPISPRLHQLELGAELEADGPWGVFTLDRAPESVPLLFVATGTGLSPIMAMLRQELSAREPRPMHLIFGVRTEADALWRSELSDMQQHPSFDYTWTLSQPHPEWSGSRGYVQEHIASALGQLGGETHCFICGLKEMVNAVRAKLKEEHGFTRKEIHTERYD